MTTTPYAVLTEHGPERRVWRRRFATYDEAVAYAEVHNPDADPTVIPTVSERLGNHPDYERGVYWFGNRYAVITKAGNRHLG